MCRISVEQPEIREQDRPRRLPGTGCGRGGELGRPSDEIAAAIPATKPRRERSALIRREKLEFRPVAEAAQMAA